MTKIDKILVVTLGTVILTAAFYAVTKNLAAAILIAVLIVITIKVLLTHFIQRKHNKSNISVSDMENELALMGAEQINYVMNSVAPFFMPSRCENGFTITKNAEKILICVNYKFSATSLDDVAKFYRYAKSEKLTKIYVLGRTPQRATILFAGELDVLFRFIPSKKLHKYLLSQNALMQKHKTVKTKNKVSLKTYLPMIFNKKRARYFALCGLSLALFSVWGTMRIYYLAVCSLCFIAAVACLFVKN